MSHSVESSSQFGNSFTNSCPDWREGTYENFKDWALKQFKVKELDSDDNAEVPVNFQKAKDIEFKKNSAGRFILPPIQDFKTTRQKQRVVRGFIGAAYRLSLYPTHLAFFLIIIITGEFTDNKRAPFPYVLAAKENQTIFLKDSVPEGFVLSDPDHLTCSQINSLYHHWLGRQRKKLSPFVILNASPQHQTIKTMSKKARGKRKMEHQEVDSDNGEGEESSKDEVEDEGELSSKEETDEEEEEEEDVEMEEVVTDYNQGTHQRLKIGPPVGRAPLDRVYSAAVASSSQGPLLRQSPRKKKGKGASQVCSQSQNSSRSRIFTQF
jgi:hypothetical protein